MHSNRTLALDVLLYALLDAWCGYARSGQYNSVPVLLNFCKILVNARFCGVCAQ